MDNINFLEDYFFSLPSQGNIYTLIPVLKEKKKPTKLLVATFNKKILCLEYSLGNYVSYEVFNSIPNEAKIISMDIVSTTAEGFNVGITYCMKDANDMNEHYLNIYYNWSISSGRDTAQYMKTIKLNYFPYFLYHTTHHKDSLKDLPVWLLSGSDCNIHAYEPSGIRDHEEVSSFEFGLSEFNDIILRFDILKLDNDKRILASCGEKGNMFIMEIEPHNGSLVVTNKHQLSYDYPVSSAKSFYKNVKMDSLSAFSEENYEQQNDPDENIYTLVATTLESAYIYRDILNKKSGVQLPHSDSYDVITCCLICDINFDGVNEVLLGTYGQTVLMYGESVDREWVLYGTLSVPSPILSLSYEDFHGNGVKQLIVHTVSGVHIFQHNPDDVFSLLLKRLEIIKERNLHYKETL